MKTRMQITVDGKIYPLDAKERTRHPPEVHAALGTSDESQLQRVLEDFSVEDWYDAAGNHLGPDENGVELFREFRRGKPSTEKYTYSLVVHPKTLYK